MTRHLTTTQTPWPYQKYRVNCRIPHLIMYYRNPVDDSLTQGKQDMTDFMVDLVSAVNSTRPELLSCDSQYVWLKAFGIFVALLGSLVLLTLLTCKRPKQATEVERSEPVYVVEAPPCYQTVIEDEEKYLPSYREAVHLQ